MDIFISQLIQVVLYTFATLMTVATLGLAVLCFASGALHVFEVVFNGDLKPAWRRVRQMIWQKKVLAFKEKVG